MIISYKRPVRPSSPMVSKIPIVSPYNDLDSAGRAFMTMDTNLPEEMKDYNAPGKAYNPYASNSLGKHVMPAPGTIIRKGAFNYDWDPGADESKFVYEDEERNVYRWNGATMEWEFTPFADREELKLKNGLNLKNKHRSMNRTEVQGNVNRKTGGYTLKPTMKERTFDSEEERKKWEFDRSMAEANKFKMINTPYMLGVSNVDPDELAMAKERQKQEEQKQIQAQNDAYNKHLNPIQLRNKMEASVSNSGSSNSSNDGIEIYEVNGPEDVEYSEEYTPKDYRTGVVPGPGPVNINIENATIKDSNGNSYPLLYETSIDQLIPGHKYQGVDSVLIYAAPYEKFFDIQKCAFVNYELEEYSDQQKIYDDLLKKEETQNKWIADHPDRKVAPQDKIDLSEIKSIINKFGLSIMQKGGEHRFAGSTKIDQIKNHPEWGVKVREDGTIDYGFEDYGYSYDEAEYLDDLLSDDYED